MSTEARRPASNADNAGSASAQATHRNVHQSDAIKSKLKPQNTDKSLRPVANVQNSHSPIERRESKLSYLTVQVFVQLICTQNKKIHLKICD